MKENQPPPQNGEGNGTGKGWKRGNGMDDLISKHAAIDAIGEQPLVWTDDDFALGRVAQWEYDVEAIKKLPSAQPERMRGKWIDEGFYADGHSAHAFRCSECGGHIIEYDVDQFCRWCGANMKGESDDRRNDSNT